MAVKERTVAMFVRGMKHSVRAKFKAWCCARELTHAEGIEELMRRFDNALTAPSSKDAAAYMRNYRAKGRNDDVSS